MPEDIAPVTLPDIDLDTQPFAFGVDEVSDGYALKLVTQDFFTYESFRRTNHDNRWNTNDALYLQYMPQRTWEGSKIPKASHSSGMIFAQVETAQPMIEQAVFGTDEWFQTEPAKGATSDEAREVKERLQYSLDHDADDFGNTARRELEMAIKDILIYGNGGAHFYYNPLTKRNCVEWVDIKDVYVDPGCPTPSIDDSRSAIRRKFYTVEQLWDMRDAPGMNIPEKDVLNFLAKRPITAAADNTKTMQEAFRGVNFVPGTSDYTANPAERKIECLIYYSVNRIIWVIGRECVIFNQPNPYKFIPMNFAPCFTVPGRFYAQGYPDVLEGYQRYAEALFNGHLNEIALALNPPRVKKPGSLMLPNQERFFPGATFQVSDPKNDVAFQNVQNVTTNVMGDIAFITSLSEKATGVNGGASGNFAAGNVNRTKGGVDAQVAGSSNRIYKIVKNVEDYLILPMLYKLYLLTQFHSETPAPQPTPEGQPPAPVGIEAFQKPIRFKMVAASKMMTRDKLLSLLPVLNQYFMNGAFLSQLHSSGQTVDFNVFGEMIQDATGTANQYALIRPLTPDEKKAIDAPPPQLVAQKEQKAADLQNRVQLQTMKSQTVLQKTQMDNAPDPSDQIAAQQDAEIKSADMRSKQEESQQKMLMDALGKQQEQRAKEQDAAQTAKQKEFEHAQKLQHDMTEHALNLRAAATENQQKLRHAEEQNAEKLKMARLLAQLKAQEAMKPTESSE